MASLKANKHSKIYLVALVNDNKTLKQLFASASLNIVECVH